MYYNIKILLTKSIPIIGDVVDVNYEDYKMAEDWFAVQSPVFGTIAVPARHIDYIHGIKVDDGSLMPPVTAAYFTT
jgi:hypothetical protein